MIGREIVQGAAYWASYLINGDASGISDAERELADAWCERNQIVDVYDVGESFFSWHYGLHTGDNVRGGDLAEYTCELRAYGAMVADDGIVFDLETGETL